MAKARIDIGAEKRVSENPRIQKDSRGIPASTILASFLPAFKKQELRPEQQRSDLGFLVAPTGFEPATSALRETPGGDE